MMSRKAWGMFPPLPIFDIAIHWHYYQQGWVVQKPVNANPGLKVNRSIKFSCLNMFFTAYVLVSLRLFKVKTER